MFEGFGSIIIVMNHFSKYDTEVPTKLFFKNIVKSWGIQKNAIISEKDLAIHIEKLYIKQFIKLPETKLVAFVY